MPVSPCLDGAVLSNFGATAPPTVTDDSASGYEIGSVWVDTVNQTVHIAFDVSIGAAVWQLLGTTPSTLNNYVATTAPAVTDDSGSGYGVGSVWVDVANDVAYLALDVSVGAAVWEQLGTTPSTLNNYGAITAPAVTDDSGSGYGVGSVWVDVANDVAYLALDVSVGAAVWQQLGSSGAVTDTNNIITATTVDAAFQEVFAGAHDVNVVATSGATETLPLEPSHKVTMDQACVFTFPTPTTLGFTFVLHLLGAFTPTFPASVDWDSATPPTYVGTGNGSVFVFTTTDTGASWLGTMVGSAYG